MLAIQSPYPQFFDTDGSPLDAGYLYFGIESLNPETAPLPVYWDAEGTQPAAQPIRTLNGYAARNGSPAVVYVSGAYSMTAKDRRGALVFYAPSSAAFSNAQSVSQTVDQLTASLQGPNGASLIGLPNGQTVAARLAETISATGFDSLQAAVTAAAGKTLLVRGTWNVSVPVTMADNTKIVLCPGAVIQATSPSISVFLISGRTNVKISGSGRLGKIKYTSQDGTSYIAGVRIDSSSRNCTVEGIAFEAMAFAGVLLEGPVYSCKVIGNSFGTALGVTQDTCDIGMNRDCVDCVIEDNDCQGRNGVGILAITPTGSGTRVAMRNLIQNNRVGFHRQYGIVLYQNSQGATWVGGIVGNTLTVTGAVIGTITVGLAIENAATGVYYGNIQSFGTGSGGLGTYILSNPTAQAPRTAMSGDDVSPTFNKIVGNHVQDIQGDPAINASSGAGYYLTGSGISGVLLDGNTAHNCCVLTTTKSLAPGGIGINGTFPGMVPPLLVDNTITGMRQGAGIYAVNCIGGIALGQNTVQMPVTNDGTGPGGAVMNLSGIEVINGSDFTIDNADVVNYGTAAALMIFASNRNSDNGTVTGGTFTASSASGIGTSGLGGNTINNIQIGGGARIRTLGASFPGLQISGVVGAVLGGLVVDAAGAPALSISASTGVRVNGGKYSSSGTVNIATTGTCTGGYLDLSADWGTSASKMNNGGTGFAVSWRSNAAPAAGTWAVGDRTEQSVPAVGQPRGWRTTVAGSPGTHVSEGNL